MHMHSLPFFEKLEVFPAIVCERSNRLQITRISNYEQAVFADLFVLVCANCMVSFTTTDL